jgi:parallel beta-helix repeat protein
MLPKKQCSLIAAFLVSSCLCVFGPDAENSSIFYVSASNGNDSNSGSASSPWRSISKAAGTVRAGATVIVRAGAYNERVQIAQSGRPGSLITYSAEGTVTMEGFTINSSYVKVIGFEIVNSRSESPDSAGLFIRGARNHILNCYIHDILNDAGIMISGGAGTNNNLVENNKITRARMAGVHVEGKDNIVQGNDISHILKDPPGSVPKGGADADGIRFFGAGNVIRSNYVHDVHLSDVGNQTNPHSDAFQTWGPVSNITIENNVILWTDDGRSGQMPGVNPQWAMIEAGPGSVVSNVVFRNNIFMHTTTRFGPMNIDDGLGGFIKDVSIVNNTFVRLNGPGIGGGSYCISLNNSHGRLTNVTIQNNMFYDCGGREESYVTANSLVPNIGYNGVYVTRGRTPAGGPNPHDIWMIDPRFVNFAARDFHLQTGSPLIDTGAAQSVAPRDKDGVARPQGRGYDIGAYEKP